MAFLKRWVPFVRFAPQQHAITNQVGGRSERVGVFFITDDLQEAPTRLAGSADVAVLEVGGEIDYQATPSLRERLATCVAANERPLLVDLSTATFIDSTAI